ncbi:Uncharacterised protein [Chlamydia abortus]|nr:Uncharacterised protein [Chlamydia abortus]
MSLGGTKPPTPAPGADFAGRTGTRGIGTRAELFVNSIESRIFLIVSVESVNKAPPACWDRSSRNVRFSNPSKDIGPLEYIAPPCPVILIRVQDKDPGLPACVMNVIGPALSL